MNMAYCRFQNTLTALKECEDALDEGNDPLAELSEEERKAAKRLLKVCRRLALNFASEIDS